MVLQTLDSFLTAERALGARGPWIVAFSGGGDSTALAVGLARARAAARSRAPPLPCGPWARPGLGRPGSGRGGDRGRARAAFHFRAPPGAGARATARGQRGGGAPGAVCGARGVPGADRRRPDPYRSSSRRPDRNPPPPHRRGERPCRTPGDPSPPRGDPAATARPRALRPRRLRRRQGNRAARRSHQSRPCDGSQSHPPSALAAPRAPRARPGLGPGCRRRGGGARPESPGRPSRKAAGKGR